MDGCGGIVLVVVSQQKETRLEENAIDNGACTGAMWKSAKANMEV